MSTKTKTFNNITKINTKIYVWPHTDSSGIHTGTYYRKKFTEIPWVKYQIKESDFRVKTASLTTPTKLDLTRGVHFFQIISPLHENFSGYILSNEFTENKDGTYTYQCQDMSRMYQSKRNFLLVGDVKTHRVLQSLITHGDVPIKGKVPDSLKSRCKSVLSGLRPEAYYDQSLWSNYLKINTMSYKKKMIIRNKSMMEVIRDLTIGDRRYVDVFFDDNGVLQIKPFSVRDWLNTGLILTADDVSSRKFKFDTTNAITGGLIESTDKTKPGKVYWSKSLVGLNLSAFFGDLIAETGNPNQSTTTTTSSGSNKSNATKKNKQSKKNATTNPFNNKKKRILVSEDRGGSAGFKSGIIKKLKKDGWSVTDLGTGPGTHSTSYKKLSKKYAVNLTLYNGVDPKTIDEPITGWLKGAHEKYGVQLVQMFDSKGWVKKTGTYNKKGIYYKRHGDFRGYRVPKAWDDNYSGARGGVLIEDLHKWYLKYYPRVIYCCGTSVSEAYAQFAAGGYFKYKGIK